MDAIKLKKRFSESKLMYYFAEVYGDLRGIKDDSIRTRIETNNFLLLSVKMPYRIKDDSIRTRIETLTFISISYRIIKY